MKRIVMICLMCSAMSAMAQSNVSKPKAFNVVKEVKPPILDIVPGSLQFVDATGNNAIDANETCYIKFKIANTGMGEGYSCRAVVKATGTTNDVTYNNVNLNVLKMGSTTDVSIPVRTGINTADGSVQFTVQVDEPNGFGTDPQYISVNTRAFEAPYLQVADYTVTGTSGNSLQKKRPFDLQVLLQNTKYGTAENVTVSIELPANVMLLDGDEYTSMESLNGGKTKSLVYSLIANNNYSGTSIPVKIHIKEKYGKYAEDKTLDLAFNQTFASNKISVDEIVNEREAITLASLGSDVDKNIPNNGNSNELTFAVIIANENYQYESEVEFAKHDGEMMKQYCVQTLGMPEQNVRLVQNATLNNIRASLGWIKQVSDAYNGQAKVVFYYSGHDIPNEATNQAYLLPVDGSGKDFNTGYPVSQLYQELSALNAQSVVAFMDACFSGAKRSGEMMASARGVAIKARQDTPKGKMVVFSASQGDETAYPYKGQSHGMFTYFLLKKLQETNGDATLGELGDYINSKVRQCSIVENSKSQTPTVVPSATVASEWRSMKLR